MSSPLKKIGNTSSQVLQEERPFHDTQLAAIGSIEPCTNCTKMLRNWSEWKTLSKISLDYIWVLQRSLIVRFYVANAKHDTTITEIWHQSVSIWILFYSVDWSPSKLKQVFNPTSVMMSSVAFVDPISGIFIAKPKSDKTQVTFGLTSTFLLLRSRWTKQGFPSLSSVKSNNQRQSEISFAELHFLSNTAHKKQSAVKLKSSSLDTLDSQGCINRPYSYSQYLIATSLKWRLNHVEEHHWKGINVICIYWSNYYYTGLLFFPMTKLKQLFSQ